MGNLEEIKFTIIIYTDAFHKSFFFVLTYGTDLKRQITRLYTEYKKSLEQSEMGKIIKNI